VGLPELRDTQCGFKLMPTPIAKKIFDSLNTPGFLFDVEILGRARILVIPIVEIGVEWRDRPDSKVRLRREIPRALWTLLQIRKNLKEYRNQLKRFSSEEIACTNEA